MGDKSQTVTVQVDNTAPAVQSNIENGQQYKGSNEIRVDVTDGGSGVASQTVRLDGKKITLPYAFASADMTTGSHTLTVTAEDTCGNKINENITFTTPEEDPMISQVSPADGLTQSTKPTFSAVATDPTGDSMTVSFKKGERYRLGDSNIQTSSGISNTSGSNTKDFDDGQSGNGFPFEQFDVTVGEQVSASDDLNVQWTGKTNETKTFLYAYNTNTGKWDRMDSTVSANGEDGTVTLNGTIALTDHLDGRIVRVMVQNGEGYTPTQYAAGASAGTPTYSHITTSNKDDTPRDNYDFTFAVESDTQYYNEDRARRGRRSEPHRHELRRLPRGRLARLRGALRAEHAHLSAECGLAADAPVQIDDLEYEVTLREDTVFSDGSPLTSADVVNAFERNGESDLYGAFLSFITAVSAPDERTVRFKLNAPMGSVLQERLALVRVFPATLTDEELATKPVGSGPWCYETINAADGGRISFTANHRYTGPWPATCERMEWSVLLDDTRRTDELIDKDVMVMEAAPVVRAEELADAGATVEWVPGFNLPFLMFNCEKPPFDDVRVRQALLYAIDVDSLIGTYMAGHARAATSLLPDYFRHYHRAPRSTATTRRKRASFWPRPASTSWR